MTRPSENVWKLIEALRRRDYSVGIGLRPDADEGPNVTVAIKGFERFTGETVDEAMLNLARSRCWDELGIPLEELEDDFDAETAPPVRPPGPPRRVKVVDILDDVKKVASQHTSPFRADHIADELNVYTAAIGHALKKLKWPRSQRKSRVEVNGREVECYVYLPVGTVESED